MVQDKSGNNGEVQVLEITQLTISWNNKNYILSRDSIIEAFEKAGYGTPYGRKARFFLKVDGDLKSLGSVLREIIPVSTGDFTREQTTLVRDIFEALGFEVLDRHKHHEG